MEDASYAAWNAIDIRGRKEEEEREGGEEKEGCGGKEKKEDRGDKGRNVVVASRWSIVIR